MYLYSLSLYVAMYLYVLLYIDSLFIWSYIDPSYIGSLYIIYTHRLFLYFGVLRGIYIIYALLFFSISSFSMLIYIIYIMPFHTL